MVNVFEKEYQELHLLLNKKDKIAADYDRITFLRHRLNSVYGINPTEKIKSRYGGGVVSKVYPEENTSTVEPVLNATRMEHELHAVVERRKER